MVVPDLEVPLFALVAILTVMVVFPTRGVCSQYLSLQMECHRPALK